MPRPASPSRNDTETMSLRTKQREVRQSPHPPGPFFLSQVYEKLFRLRGYARVKRLTRYGVWSVILLCALVGTTAAAYQPGFFGGGHLFDFSSWNNDELSDEQKKQMQHAVAVCTQHIEQGTENLHWYLFRASYNFGLYELDDILSDFDYLVEQYPESDWVLSRRGDVFAYMENAKRSIKDYSSALALNSENFHALYHRGRLYTYLEEYENALIDLNHVITLNDTYIWGYIRRAEVLEALGLNEKAFVDLSKIIELDPDYAWAYRQRGWFQRKFKDYDAGIADFDIALELEPDSEWGLAHRGWMYSKLKNYDSAISDFTHALQIDPEYEWVYYRRGKAYFNTGKYQLAEQDFTQAILLDPSYGEYYRHRGLTRKRLNNIWGSMLDMDKSMALNDGTPRGTFAFIVSNMLGFAILLALMCIIVPSILMYTFYQKKKRPRPPALPSS